MSKSSKLMLLAAMLATVLALAIPAVAMVNTGNFTNQQGVLSSGSTGDVETGGGDSTSDFVGTEGDGSTSHDDAVSEENACRNRVIDTLVSELGITPAEAVELLDFLEAANNEEFDAAVEEFCAL